MCAKATSCMDLRFCDEYIFVLYLIDLRIIQMVFIIYPDTAGGVFINFGYGISFL